MCSHRRTHNLLLISKLLNLREGASPLTLIVDSLEQPATRLLTEYIRRGQLSRSNIIFVSFETLEAPDGVDIFITTRWKTLQQIAKEICDACRYNAPSTATAVAATARAGGAIPVKKNIVIFDSVHPLATRKSQSHGGPVNIVSYFGSLLAMNAPNPTSRLQVQTSLLAVYHSDIPGPSNSNPYAPSLYSLLSYLSTVIITVRSTDHMLAEKAARDRSLAAPVFGLASEQDGIVIGESGAPDLSREDRDGMILLLDHRRRSGRNVEERYFLPAEWTYDANYPREVVMLLDDHPLWKRREEEERDGGGEMPESTFELGLTERQRRDRENVVLPYFDAQRDEGPGEGGRILYDMGEEDDFDEEEDEI
ncbi:hypothetical protein KEM54_001280 [Ascosphaera aggregata]|nr:hypothetical protein KEM54_001280 [Ascosphaera aggregata]